MAAAHPPPHPYVPRDLSLPGYVPGLLPASTISGVYLGASALVVSLVWLLSGWSPWRSKVDRLLMCWLAYAGLSQMILSGYIVLSPDFYKDPTGFYLAELYKEYSKADSRYVSGDSTVHSIETLTALVKGPACILAMFAIATDKPYSYILQFAISLGQLYGTTMYFITAVLEGDNFSASPYYYYSYYVMANAPWVLIPAIITVRCWRKISAAAQFHADNKKKAKSH